MTSQGHGRHVRREPGDHHDHDHPDDHDHDANGHGHGHRGGWRGAIGEVFRPHSHDAADSLDTALEANRQGIRAVKISFGALMTTSIVQVLIIVATGSVALLADTIHNFSDALTAIPLFLAFRLSRRPANRRYTYGYGRAEDLAGVFVIAMITLSSVIAAYEAIQRLIHPRTIHNVGWLVAAGVIGFVGNELVALYRIRVGQQIGSAALTADGYHARTDGFASLAVALGALGASLGLQRADPIVGLAISIAIFAVLRGAARQVLRRLMDGVDPEIVERIEHVATTAPGVRGVTDIRVRLAGSSPDRITGHRRRQQPHCYRRPCCRRGRPPRNAPPHPAPRHHRCPRRPCRLSQRPARRNCTPPIGERARLSIYPMSDDLAVLVVRSIHTGSIADLARLLSERALLAIGDRSQVFASCAADVHGSGCRVLAKPPRVDGVHRAQIERALGRR